jgi:hypothetical protein
MIAVAVNNWTEAATDVLRTAGVSQAHVAEVELRINRAALSPYLNGTRTPSPEKVLDVNDAIGNAANDPGAAAYLDCEAATAGLLPIEYLGRKNLVDGARLALEELGVGFLVPNWPTRLASALATRSQERIGKFLLALNREHRRLLRNKTPVPWKEGLDAVAIVLRKFGLGDLIETARPTRDRVNQFRNTVRKELDRIIDSTKSARERYDVENRLVLAALELAARSGSLSELRTLDGGKQ